MSVITKCVPKNMKTNTYLEWPANEDFERITRTWNNLVRSNIALEPYQIRQTLIMKVNSFRFTGSFHQLLYRCMMLDFPAIQILAIDLFFPILFMSLTISDFRYIRFSF